MTKSNEESIPDAPVNELDILLAAGPEATASKLISKQPAVTTVEDSPSKKRAAVKSKAKSTGVELSQAQRDIPHQKRLSDMIAAHDAKSRQRRAENQARRASNIPRTGQR